MQGKKPEIGDDVKNEKREKIGEVIEVRQERIVWRKTEGGDTIHSPIEWLRVEGNALIRLSMETLAKISRG